MCLIIKKEPTQKISPKFLDGVRKRNKDGWGIAWWTAEGDMHVRKGLEYKEFWSVYKRVEDRNLEAVIHFRLRTKGDIDFENCHPYKVAEGLHFIHNGTLTRVPHTNPAMSDTWHFANVILKPLIEVNGVARPDMSDLIRSPGFRVLMNEFANTSNKLVLVDREGPVIYGDVALHWVKTPDGLLVSNSYAWDRPSTVTPVNNYAPRSYGYDADDYYGYGGVHGNRHGTFQENKSNQVSTPAVKEAEKAGKESPKVKLVAGKTYLTREGRKVLMEASPANMHNAINYPFCGRFETDIPTKVKNTWTADGRWNALSTTPSINDIVAEWVAPETNVIPLKNEKAKRLIAVKEGVKCNADIWPYIAYHFPSATSQDVGKAITKVLKLYPNIRTDRLLEEVIIVIASAAKQDHLFKRVSRGVVETSPDHKEPSVETSRQVVSKLDTETNKACECLVDDSLDILNIYGVGPEDFADYLGALTDEEIRVVCESDPAAAALGIQMLLLERYGVDEEEDEVDVKSTRH